MPQATNRATSPCHPGASASGRTLASARHPFPRHAYFWRWRHLASPTFPPLRRIPPLRTLPARSYRPCRQRSVQAAPARIDTRVRAGVRQRAPGPPPGARPRDALGTVGARRSFYRQCIIVGLRLINDDDRGIRTLAKYIDELPCHAGNQRGFLPGASTETLDVRIGHDGGVSWHT